ncbi:alkene reductase [Occultella glacieicola]|uniref:Alkene reductase n=1 Tax=Occultella glacieicola TaxID=2518684 RepID=A0ABY2E2W0_9MICO|nr:alkene reductase [Occultella glacieicola]TDE93956.1 alkene reductase [Occultella glacieicola]
MSNDLLLRPYSRGRLQLPNRLVMAPMTRYRAAEDGTPLPIVADYYAQRASAGLIVSEGIYPERRGQSGWRVPGLTDAEHVAGWRRVTDAVHAHGGRIWAQLMHGGRNGHPLAGLAGDLPLAPSAVPAAASVHLPDGTRAAPVMPRVMTEADIASTVAAYARSARLAIDAGFDGVELHGANNYLIHQFLADNTNLRTDGYGGRPRERARFALEVTSAVAHEIGAHRTAIRLSPGNPQFGIVEADPGPVYRPLVDRLDRLGLAYLHLTEADDYPALADLRPRWHGTLIANVGENRDQTTRDAGEQVLRAGLADLVSYGRAFLANPDLPARFALRAPLNPIEQAHLYTPGARGYLDYPALVTEGLS